jgi:hypothetical protein
MWFYQKAAAAVAWKKYKTVVVSNGGGPPQRHIGERALPAMKRNSSVWALDSIRAPHRCREFSPSPEFVLS